MAFKNPHPKAVAKSSLLDKERRLLSGRADDVRAAYSEYCDEREVYVDNAMMRAKTKNGRIMPQAYEDAIFLSWSKRRPFAPRPMDVDELEAKLASLNEELFGDQGSDYRFALDAMDKRHLRQEIASVQAQITALVGDDPLDTSDMDFLEEHEEQQEDPMELIMAADAAGYRSLALEEALQLLNTNPTTAEALTLADRRVLVATAAKASAAKVAIVPWTYDDERDYQLKKEVREILSRF